MGSLSTSRSQLLSMPSQISSLVDAPSSKIVAVTRTIGVSFRSIAGDDEFGIGSVAVFVLIEMVGAQQTFIDLSITVVVNAVALLGDKGVYCWVVVFTVTG